jgi:DNA-binding CsgD family transcriptional regulator/tetratricopeptide (TPR) repeat protein
VHTWVVGRETAGTRFVDRIDELDRLMTALDDATAGHPSLMLVGGDAGVGKTRLLAEFVGAVDGLVLRGGCLPLGERGLPFAPVVEVLRGLIADGRIPEASPALERLVSGAPAGPSERPSGQAHLFLAFLRLLEDLSADRPVALILEDVHWADRSTRELLSFVAHNLRDQRLLVVASYRADDLDREHPLRLLLAELHRNPRVDRMELAAFSASHVADYLEAITGSRPSLELVAEIVERTDGNAFFIEELVAADGLNVGTLPQSLRDLLLARTQALSPEAQKLLRIASAAGRRVDHSLLAAVADRPADEIIDLVREAVSQQLLVPDGDGYRLRHALLREVLHADLLPGERVAVHASYAAALSAAPDLARDGRAAAAAELADHWQEAGDTPRALTAWVEAGEAAEGLAAFAEARHHFEHVLDVWDRVPDAHERAGASRLDILRHAAEDAFLGGDPQGAAALGRRALALVDAQTEPLLAGLLHDRLARYLWDTTDQPDALGIQQRAVELVPSDPPSPERAHVLAGLGGHLMVLGQYQEARRVSEEAIAVAREVGAPRAEYVALNTLGTIVCTTEDVDAGLGLVAEALRMAEANDDALEQMRGYWNLFANSFAAARWEQTLVRFREAADALPRLGQAHLVPELQVIAADCLVRLGRWDEAERMVADARSRQRAGEDPIRLPELDIARGDFVAARDYLERQGIEQPVVNKELEGWPRINLAEIAVWEGRPDAARDLIKEGLGITADQDESLATAYLCAVGLRAEADRADESRVRQRHDDRDEAIGVGSGLLELMRGVLSRPGPADGWKREVGALGVQCEAEATRLLGEPDPAAWVRAVAAWASLSMPYAAAYCGWRHAEALLGSAGPPADARAALIAGHDTAVALGAAPLLEAILRLARRARIDVGSERPAEKLSAEPALTPREREVLELVAAGRSNHQIATTLFISDKTASVHVSNILRKLEVSSRGEAAAMAYRRGLVG